MNKKSKSTKNKIIKKGEEIPPPPIENISSEVNLPTPIMNEKLENNAVNENKENKMNKENIESMKYEENNNEENIKEDGTDIPPVPFVENEDKDKNLPQPVSPTEEEPKEIEEPLYPNAIYFPTIPAKIMNILVNYMTDVQKKVNLSESKYLTEEEINSSFLWEVIAVYYIILYYLFSIEC